MKVAVLCLARPTFDVPFAQEIADQALGDLSQRDFEVIGDATLLFDADSTLGRWHELKAQAPDRVLLLQVTFADATMATEIAQDWGQCIHIIGFDEARTGERLRLNSFCGVNLACHAFNRADLPYRAGMHSDGSAAEFLEATTPKAPTDGPELPAANVASGEALAQFLSGKTIGRLGDHPDGFTTCAVDEPALDTQFGVSVEAQPIQALFKAAEKIAPARVASARADAASKLAGLDDVDQDELNKALAAGEALDDLVKENQLAGVAVRCWPETFTEYGCAICGAMARQNGAGIPASCEADVPGTITSLLLQQASGGSSLLVDVVDFDTDSAVVWHCGLAPLDMAGTAPKATIHSNRKKPLLHQFALKAGTVTLARLSQIDGKWTLVLGLAEMLDAPRAFGGTAGTLRFRETPQVIQSRLLALGLEHHVSITYGDHLSTLAGFAATKGLPIVSLC